MNTHQMVRITNCQYKSRRRISRGIASLVRRLSGTFSMGSRAFSLMDHVTSHHCSATQNALSRQAGIVRFGELLFELREARQLSQRQLAGKAGLAPSTVSQLENARRTPPSSKVVAALAQALQATPLEWQILAEAAERERTGLGLKVGKKTPQHVADLLREIATVSHQLSPAKVQSLRAALEETSM